VTDSTLGMGCSPSTSAKAGHENAWHNPGTPQRSSSPSSQAAALRSRKRLLHQSRPPLRRRLSLHGFAQAGLVAVAAYGSPPARARAVARLSPGNSDGYGAEAGKTAQVHPVEQPARGWTQHPVGPRAQLDGRDDVPVSPSQKDPPAAKPSQPVPEQPKPTKEPRPVLPGTEDATVYIAAPKHGDTPGSLSAAGTPKPPSPTEALPRSRRPRINSGIVEQRLRTQSTSEQSWVAGSARGQPGTGSTSTAARAEEFFGPVGLAGVAWLETAEATATRPPQVSSAVAASTSDAPPEPSTQQPPSARPCFSGGGQEAVAAAAAAAAASPAFDGLAGSPLPPLPLPHDEEPPGEPARPGASALAGVLPTASQRLDRLAGAEAAPLPPSRRRLASAGSSYCGRPGLAAARPPTVVLQRCFSSDDVIEHGRMCLYTPCPPCDDLSRAAAGRACPPAILSD
jgi:hypothetical protein